MNVDGAAVADHVAEQFAAMIALQKNCSTTAEQLK